ncbi:MAG: hypothetical protein KatS3mg031_2952 [Chitinophagales bacterium]|nr:MAG: hypothetical protein KatS3mg031_2952 [Chitinophagales bacterium]
MAKIDCPLYLIYECRYGELSNYKVYLNKGNYSRFIIAFLKKHGVKTFIKGNDAPRGRAFEEKTLTYAESLGIKRETAKEYLKALRDNRPVNYRKGYLIANKFGGGPEFDELRIFYFSSKNMPKIAKKY